MAILDTILDAFSSWLWLFGAPIKDFNVLWIIIPIWISWFFTEFFQEKRGTGFGNAITNGAIPIWVAIDWSRYITRGLAEETVMTDFTLYVKYGLAAFILIYGLVVIIEGLHKKEFAHFGGRIRVITYFLVMFTPIIYGTAAISVMNIVSIFVFFPVFYLLIELIVRVIPDSAALSADKGEDSPYGMGQDPFSPPPDGGQPGSGMEQRFHSQGEMGNAGPMSPLGQRGPGQYSSAPQQYQEPDFDALPHRDQMQMDQRPGAKYI